MIGAGINANMVPVMAQLQGGPGQLFNPDAFVNPEAAIVASLTGAGVDPQADIMTNAIAPLYVLSDPLATLYNAISAFCGGSVKPVGGITPPVITYSAMSQYGALTNFLSGKLSVFPSSSLDPELDIANIAFLTGMDYSGLISVSSNGAMTVNTLGQTDPEVIIQTIFGPVLGSFDAQLNAILAQFTAMTETLDHTADYLAQVQAASTAVLAIIKNSIQAFISLLYVSANLSLAKQLTSLYPSMNQVLNATAGADLKRVLGI